MSLKELRKEKNEPNINNNDKEDLLSQMMMPRQHSKS